MLPAGFKLVKLQTNPCLVKPMSCQTHVLPDPCPSQVSSPLLYANAMPPPPDPEWPACLRKKRTATVPAELLVSGPLASEAFFRLATSNEQL